MNAVPDSRLDTDDWVWPLNLASYDRNAELTATESAAVALVAAHTGGPGKAGGSGGPWPSGTRSALARLLEPIHDACAITMQGVKQKTSEQRTASVRRAFVLEMHRTQRAIWGWSCADWAAFAQPSLQAFNARNGWSWSRVSKPGGGTRTRVVLIGYLLGGIHDPRPHCEFGRDEVARLVFGDQAVETASEPVFKTVVDLGYSTKRQRLVHSTVMELLLLNRDPRLERLSRSAIDAAYATSQHKSAVAIALVSRVLSDLGVIESGIPAKRTGPAKGSYRGAGAGLDNKWADWCDLWHSLSTCEQRTRDDHHRILLMLGRWLNRKHPLVHVPEQWDGMLASEAVTAICGWKTGEFCAEPSRNPGKPLRPRTIAHYLAAVRQFFIDLQVSERIRVRFNPNRFLATPTSVLRKIRPNPRVIEKRIWAKLVWAGQHLVDDDRPSAMYPIAMVRAVAAVWLFTALRSDEIARLTVGCVQWPATPIHDPDTGSSVEPDAVCYLLVPINKTTGEFKKPVTPVVGRMIEAWVAERPVQPARLDAKSASMSEFLFSMRGRRISTNYINNTLIPMLAKKAGLDPVDQRGPITSHRARATIATYLGNSERPMTLIQLMKWLGHASPESTRHYVEADISKMAVKVAEGSFFQQNLASIPVIIDTLAVTTGAASEGAPWKYFDLGHGLCKLSEWSSCRHRMACAKCDYFEPKDSMRMQLLEANGNLSKMLEFIALGDDERKLVSQGVSINNELLAKLQTVKTPSGKTPMELKSGVDDPIALTSTVHLITEDRG